MTAFIPEAQTLFTVVHGVVTGSPELKRYYNSITQKQESTILYWTSIDFTPVKSIEIPTTLFTEIKTNLS